MYIACEFLRELLSLSKFKIKPFYLSQPPAVPVMLKYAEEASWRDYITAGECTRLVLNYLNIFHCSPEM